MDANHSAQQNMTSPKYQLQSVSRALRLLNVLADVGSEGISLTEAANQIGASKSTTFNLLRTLIDFDYAATFGQGPRYRLGPAVVHLADSHATALPWLELARPIARQLTSRTTWTSRLATHTDGYPVFVERVDSPGTIRFFTALGIREAPHLSAAGKAILAALDEATTRRIAEETQLLPRKTEHTITDVETLLRDRALTRARGYAIDDEEGDLGVICVAAAFCGRDGSPIGAISITGLKADMSDGQLHEFGVLVRQAADDIAHAVGGRPWIPPTLRSSEEPARD